MSWNFRFFSSVFCMFHLANQKKPFVVFVGKFDFGRNCVSFGRAVLLVCVFRYGFCVSSWRVRHVGQNDRQMCLWLYDIHLHACKSVVLLHWARARIFDFCFLAQWLFFVSDEQRLFLGRKGEREINDELIYIQSKHVAYVPELRQVNASPAETLRLARDLQLFKRFRSFGGILN